MDILNRLVDIINASKINNGTKLFLFTIAVVTVVILWIKIFNRNDDANSRPITEENTHSYNLPCNDFNDQDFLCTGDVFTHYLAKDIRNCRDWVILFSPFLSKPRINQLKDVFRTAIAHGKRIYVVTKDLSFRAARERQLYINCERMLASIGVRVIHKGDMHEKLIFIDGMILWSGSLNALSYNGRTSEVMERRTDRRIVEEYERLLHISDILFLC